MKRFIALLLSCMLIITACSCSYNDANTPETAVVSNDSITENNSTSENITETTNDLKESVADESAEEYYGDLDALNANHIPEYYEAGQVTFNSLEDEQLLDYIETEIAKEVMATLDSSEYVIEDISATYISKEYIDELTYNSQSNIFFGYTLEEVDEMFQGTRYVFTLGEKGETIVTEFESYDDTYEKMLKNVAIGTGVIVVCVTVSVVTAGTAPAVSFVFAASAKTATEFALENAIISGIITTGISAYSTGDWEQALKNGALSASEGFKVGSIMGAATGGVSSFIKLKNGTGGGLNMDEVAVILKENDLPSSFLKQIKSMDQYNELVQIAENGGLKLSEMANVIDKTGYPLEIVKHLRSTKEGEIYFDGAKLTYETVGGKLALVRDIDLTYKSELNGEIVTNLERMSQGYAPIDPVTQKAYELHHIGQEVDSPLAILSMVEHRTGENNGILHDLKIADGEGVHALLSDSEWATQREDFWLAFAEIASKGK